MLTVPIQNEGNMVSEHHPKRIESPFMDRIRLNVLEEHTAINTNTKKEERRVGFTEKGGELV